MLKFLIVDDDPDCRRLVRHYLSRYGRCDVVHNGCEAIGAMRIALDGQSPYDLVCLDMMMPCADGHKVLKDIRELEKEHGIHGSDGVKVMIATSLADPKHCLQAFREGCEAYLTKPFDQQSLLAQVGSLLGELSEEIKTSRARLPAGSGQTA